MPLYDYRCQDCRNVTTVLEKYDSKDKNACPDCGSGKMEKLMPIFGIGKGSNPSSSSKGSSSCSGCTSGSCGSCSCH